MKTTEKRVAEAFTESSGRYAQLYDGTSRVAHFFRARMRRVGELLDNIGSGQVLEIGCGPGLLVDTLVKRGFEYVGVDISPGMIAQCKEKHGDSPQKPVRFLVGDVQRLEFSSGSFDLVICLGALEYVPRIDLALQEIRRVLRPGGTAIISCINRWSPYNVWDRIVFRPLARGSSYEMVREFHSEKEFYGLTRQQGLQMIDIVYFDFNVFLSPFDKLLVRVAASTTSRMEKLGRTWLKQIGNGFLVKCISKNSASDVEERG